MISSVKENTSLSLTLLFLIILLPILGSVGNATDVPLIDQSETIAGSTESNSTTSSGLAELEPRIKESAAVLAEVARLEELMAQLEYERTKAGWKIIGQLRGGYIDEQLTNEERREYYPSQISAGLTYPLLGKRIEEKNRLLELEAGTQNEQLRIAVRRLDVLESLRVTYILLWAAERKVELAEAFLMDAEHKLRVLEKRVETGHLLRSDYLEFSSALDLANRERAVNINTAERARDLIKALTGVELEIPLITPPDLPASCESLDQAVSHLADNAEIMLHQNNVELELERLALSSGVDIKGDLTIQGMLGSSENVNTDYGYGGMVSLNFSLPLNPFTADNDNKTQLQRRLNRFQRELQLKTEELNLALKDRFRRRQAEQTNIQFARTRLQAATELLREKTLRVDRIPGDVLEQLQKARYNYYRVAVDFVEAEARLLNSSARILRYCPAGTLNRSVVAQSGYSVIKPLYQSGEIIANTSFVVEPQPLQEDDAKLAVYLWQSQSFIDGSEPVEALKAQGIDRILISLDANQLAALRVEEGKEQIRVFLQNCRLAGISPGVLLGEPTWILPQYRGNLLEILHGLNDIPFDRVHLDLEPAQLDKEKYGLSYLGAQLLRTLQLAVEVSNIPVEISVHPRMFSLEEVALCFGCALANIDLERVVVMIYRTDSDQVQRKMDEIAQDYPYLNLALAQSVETILGPQNSYAHLGKQVFQSRVRKFMMQGEKRSWQGDVYIQDWASYKILPDIPNLETSR